MTVEVAEGSESEDGRGRPSCIAVRWSVLLWDVLCELE